MNVILHIYGVTTFGVLCRVLVNSPQKGYCRVRKGSRKGNRMRKGCSILVQGKKSQRKHAIEKADREKFWLPLNARSYAHPMKINVGRLRTAKPKYLFTQQIVKLWKSLPQEGIVTTNLDNFKRIDKFMEDTAVNFLPEYEFLETAKGESAHVLRSYLWASVRTGYCTRWVSDLIQQALFMLKHSFSLVLRHQVKSLH